MSYEWIKWKRGGRWVDNDEGYNYQYCHSCGGRTEHDMDSCIPCVDRRIAYRSQQRKKNEKGKK